jgi:alpha-glucuronidase
MKTKTLFSGLSLLLLSSLVCAEDGYNLWLRYNQVADTQILNNYRNSITQVVVYGNSPTMVAAKEELKTGLTSLMGTTIEFADQPSKDGALLVGSIKNSPLISGLIVNDQLKTIGKEGYIIRNAQTEGTKVIVVGANSDIGALYGVFGFLRLLQEQSDISNTSVVTSPRIQLRMLDHWDNLNGKIERGYAGESL